MPVAECERHSRYCMAEAPRGLSARFMERDKRLMWAYEDEVSIPPVRRMPSKSKELGVSIAGCCLVTSVAGVKMAVLGVESNCLNAESICRVQL